MSAPSLVLWSSDQADRIAARVAVAGDFLPTGVLSLPQGGWSKAARGAAPVFDDVDISFLNLECPLDADGLSFRPLTGIGNIVFANSDSIGYLQAIRALPVSLANNHAYDFGASGVARTRTALAHRNLTSLGAGRTLRRDPESFVWQGPENIRLGFWAAARASRDLATRRAEGVEPATLARARLAATALKSQGAQFSIALLHAGCLRTNRPEPSDAKLMDSIASCGFNVVAACHSHRIGGFKRIETHSKSPAFCFYGLGSIVSGYVASPLEREGIVIIAGFHLDGSLASLKVRAVHLAESGFAEVPSPNSARATFDRFVNLSRELSGGISAARFYEDISRGLIPLYARDLRAAFRQSGLMGLARKATRIRIRHLRRVLHGIVS